jgi:hypothetical protein
VENAVNGINSNILASDYGVELKLAAVRSCVGADDGDLVQRVLTWCFAGVTATPISAYYEAALSPFEGKSPPIRVQKVLMSVLLARYGDPRIGAWPGLEGREGAARREVCVSTMKRWLSIEYLDLFIRIIEKTAEDKQFKPRKAFWLRYFERSVVSDVTLIIASDAMRIARKIRSEMNNPEYMKWANLLSALPNQSVLLMQIGDLIIAEWSHSGAMRFWKAGEKAAPKFHLGEYWSSTLRRGSLKVKVGSTVRDSIIHHENGHWMTWARNAIEYHTGVRV